MTHPAETGQALLEVSRRHAKKPLLTSFMGVISSAPAAEFLRVNNIPTFGTPDDAVRAYMYMCQYTRNLQLLYETPKDILPDFHPDRAKVKGIFNELARAGCSKLTEFEARKVLDVLPHSHHQDARRLEPAGGGQAGRADGLSGGPQDPDP